MPRLHATPGRSHRCLTQADLGAQTRERLLEAAERLFSQRGYAGASVRDVTTAAGCNLAAVNYHFGSKRNLYVEMFHRRLAAIRDQRVGSVRDAMRRAHGPRALETVLEAFAGAFLEPLVAKPEGRRLIELMARETVDPQLPPDLFATEFVEPVRRMLVEAITATTSEVLPHDAALCVISIIGQLVQVAQVNRRATDSGGRLTAPPIAEAVDHIVRFSAAGVRGCRTRATRTPVAAVHETERQRA